MNSNTKKTSEEITEHYIKFVRERCKNTNYRAEEKLRYIDELAEIIFKAKKSYKNKSK